MSDIKHYDCGFCDEILAVDITVKVNAYLCNRCGTWNGLDVQDDGTITGLYPMIQESIDNNDE